MDPNLELYRSIVHLEPWDRREHLRHLSQSERDRVRIIVDREQHAQRQELIAGRDLVQMALTDPSEIIQDMHLKYTLLGRTTYYYDECKMVKRITNDVASMSSSLVNYIAGFNQSPQPLPLDAWKLVYCDIYYVDGGNATLPEIYETRCREEELQTPAARARELVRDNDLRRARRNAKWMIPAIERLSAEEQTRWTLEDAKLVQELMRQGNYEEASEPLSRRHEYEETLVRLWKQVSPAPPAWIQNILETREEFGFVYYMSREVDQKHGYDWDSVWSGINEHCSPLRVGWYSIHTQGRDNWMKLDRLETEDWPTFYPNESMAEDDDLRKHFKEYMEEKGDLLSSGILRNTFIVIPIELISQDNLRREEGDFLDPYWVWAYDADWDSSKEETIVDGEKYQGRVKVAKWSVNSWFYAARWEGVSLRDMWLKALQHPDKLWICYTKELEEWDHEPYI
ncbi:hypothetical protein F53441_2884 [Fusarium austroafricanum]|uniref:Uncharacterized protein n=1 Tax=Fusarium austroafricanum TaxID=2364996 RepID=A0A8H4P0K4_9HYPO|nr:hypothetical protein F53441_2884 [Fusarium austroafricanum]